MITTIKALIKAKGFKPYKKYEVDAWIGEYSIWGSTYYHATAIVMLDNGDMFVWFDKEFNVYSGKQECTRNWEGTRKFHFNSDESFCYADSRDEMREDYKKMKDAHDEYVFNLKSEVVRTLKKLVEPLKPLTHTDVKEISRVFDDVEGLQPLRDELIVRTYKKYGIDPDLASRIESIYKTHSVTVSETYETSSPGTTVTINLDRIETVEFCDFDEKNKAVLIKIGEHRYFIYEENDPDEYHALCILYGNF